MASTKKYLNEMFGTVLVLSALLSTVSAVDCNGKSFHCVNSTHFMICVDLGGGKSQAIDDFLVACPPPTVCQGTNHFECEFPAPTTPSTTLNNIISEITQPWEEVVTVSSTGNTTKEFSENYMNTERITTTSEYSVTTDTTVDSTTATASELYVDNKLNIPEIVPTLPAEIATSAIETTETLNIADYVPTEVTVDITTAVIETVTQTTAESKNLTETGPAIVDEITKIDAEITTDTTVGITTATASELYVNNKLNIPEIIPTLPAEIATSAIETTETLNITEYVPTEVTVDITTAVIETVTQTTAESKNLTETGPVIVGEITKIYAEITTDTTVGITTATASELYVNNKLNIPEIIPTLPAEIATSAIETTQTLNENLNITEYVPTEVTVDITTAVIETVTQTTAESKNLTETGPAIVDEITKIDAEITTDTTVDITTATASELYVNNKINIPEIIPTLPAEIATSAIQTTQTLNENLNITEYVPTEVTVDITTAVIETVTQTTAESKNLTETGPVIVGEITKIYAEITTDTTVGITTATASELYVNNKLNIPEIIPTLPAEIATSAIETTQTLNENLNITEYVPTEVTVDITNAVIETVTQTTAESKNLTETGPAIVDEITKIDAEITTDTTVDITTATASELYVNNKINIPEIIPTLPAEIATSEIQTTQTLNENLNITEYVPTEVTVDITTAVIETVTQTTAESKNLTETGPVIVGEITKIYAEITTDTTVGITTATASELYVNNKLNIPEIIPTLPAEIATSAIETTQTLNENLNITEYVPTEVTVDITTAVIETVTQTTAESKNLTETGPAIVDEITKIAAEITTDTTVDLTTATASKLNIQDIVPTLPAEIATSAIETTQTLNENMNTSDYVPTEVTVDITAAVIETQTQTTAESKNLTETGPAIVDEITKAAAEIITENIIIIDTAAAETGYKPRQESNVVAIDITTPIIERVTHNTAPENVVANKFTATTAETTTKNVIIKDNLGTGLGYIESTATEHITLTTSDSFLELETVQSITKPDKVTILPQKQRTDTLPKGPPKAQHKKFLNIEKPISSAADNITSTLHNVSISKTKNASNTNTQNILPAKTTAALETIVETAIDSTGHLTTLPVNMVTDNLITAPQLNNTIQKPESVKVSEPSKPPTSFEGSLRSNSSFMGNKHSAANEIENNEMQMPTIHDRVTPYDRVASGNRTEKVTNATDERVVGSDLNSTTLPVMVTRDVTYDHETKDNNLNTTTNKSLSENNYTPVNNAPNEITLKNTTDTQNLAEATVLDGTWTETIENGASTEQPTTINEGSLTTDTIKNVVTEYIIVPTRQSGNLDFITADVVPTTVSAIPSILPAFEDNINNDAQLPVTENIISTRNNEASTNGLTSVESVNMDTLTTEAVTIPTIISSAQPITSFEDNMKIETTLPVTENIASTVNNEGSTKIFLTAQEVHMDTITTKALDIPTTVSNTHLTPPAFEENMKIEISLPETENTVSTVNGISTNGFMTAQAVNTDTITTETVGISTAISNTQSILSTVEDIIKIEAPFGNALATTTENIVLKENNGVDKNDPINAQASDLNTISTDAIYMQTTVIKDQALAFIDIDEESLPTTNISNGVHVDEVNTEAMYGTYTTISNVNPKRPNFEEDIATDTPLTDTGNIESSVNYGIGINKSTTAQPVNVDEVNTEITHIPTTISNRPPNAPSIEGIMIDVPLPATGIYLSSVNNGASTTTAVNVDKIKTQATINNVPAMAPAFDSTRTESSLSATKNVVSAINNGVSTNDLTTLNAERETVVQLTTETYFVSPSKVIEPSLDNEKTVETVHGDIITTESGTLLPDNVKASPNNAIKKIKKIINSSANTAVEAELKENYDDNEMTTITNLRENLPVLSLPSKNIPVAGLSVDKSTSHVSQIENVNEPALVYNAATSRTEASPMNDNITKATTSKSIPTIGSDSNQNSMNPQAESKTTQVNNSLQSRTTERIDQANDKIWNPLANQVFDLNQNSQSIGFSVTNINAEENDRDATSLNVEITSPQGSTGITGSPIYAYIDHAQSIDYIITQKSIGVKGSNDISTINGYSESISKVNSQHETDYRLNSQSKIPVTIPLNQKTDKLATAGVDVSSVSTTEATGVETPIVTDLKSASQNISFNTKKAPQKPIGIDKTLSFDVSLTHQNNSSTNITSSTSSKARNIPINTVRTPSQVVIPNTISNVNNNLNKQVPTHAAQTFTCINGVRGRYSDKDDCRKFYICIGNQEPIVGYCPETAVFSDLKKLCTKNMSHCIRENQFKCPSAGRFSDFMNDNVYYICINHNTKLYRFKFQCQKGYILDKTTVHCIETKEIESNESVSISSNNNSRRTSSSSISSSTSSKSISTSSSSNNSRKPDNSSNNNDSSSKSKKSKEAVETSEKSDGNDDDDDDDEVFKCKKEGKFPIRNECRRYYLCKKNKKSEYRRKIKKCNSGKVFHKDKKKCVDDDSYEC